MNESKLYALLVSTMGSAGLGLLFLKFPSINLSSPVAVVLITQRFCF